MLVLVTHLHKCFVTGLHSANSDFFVHTIYFRFFSLFPRAFLQQTNRPLRAFLLMYMLSQLKPLLVLNFKTNSSNLYLLFINSIQQNCLLLLPVKTAAAQQLIAVRQQTTLSFTTRSEHWRTFLNCRSWQVVLEWRLGIVFLFITCFLFSQSFTTPLIPNQSLFFQLTFTVSLKLSFWQVRRQGKVNFTVWTPNPRRFTGFTRFFRLYTALHFGQHSSSTHTAVCAVWNQKSQFQGKITWVRIVKVDARRVGPV